MYVYPANDVCIWFKEEKSESRREVIKAAVLLNKVKVFCIRFFNV